MTGQERIDEGSALAKLRSYTILYSFRYAIQFVILVGCIGLGCGAPKQFTTSFTPLSKTLQELELDQQYYSGLSIYDPETKQFLAQHRSNNLFTPASNTKILTLFASLYFLDDTLDAAYYLDEKDTMYIWGGSDPGTLYPCIHDKHPLIEFIRSANKPVAFSTEHFHAERFGPGWAWDDHPYAFQTERNAIQLMGNRIWIVRNKDTIDIFPKYFRNLVTIDSDASLRNGKTEWGDKYYYKVDVLADKEEIEIPITYFRNDLLSCWSELTNKGITASGKALPEDPVAIKGSVRDTMLKLLMQDSDNFIAEQLLLACSMKGLGYMSDEDVIDSLLRGPLHDLPDEIKWVDGSGLSRYNQLTPDDLVWILDKISRVKGMDYVREIFPAGGQSGNLVDWYPGENGVPYIYAKTGTMQQVHNLSGFLFTKSGKVLIFSWMHNHLHGKNDAIKKKNKNF